MYIIRFGKQADKDKKLLKGAELEGKAKNLLHVIAENPFQNPPPYEGLVGELICSTDWSIRCIENQLLLTE